MPRNHTTPSDILFLFPGQGAQHVGMGKDIYDTYAQARKIFDRADHLLDFPLTRLCFNGPQEVLFEDVNAQLAVYTVSCAITDILRAEEIFPGMVTGYSSGFYAAAYAVGCFNFDDGLDVVRRAGEMLLAEGGRIDGAMAAVFGLNRELVDTICQEVGNVFIAIRHTTRQVVISGLKSSVTAVMEKCRAQGALDAYLLTAQTAYHSPFVAACCERFLKEIPDDFFGAAHVPIFSYSFLKEVRSPLEIKDCMARQLTHPVYWVDLIKKLSGNGPKRWIEAGPGAMLYRSVRWIDRNIDMLHTTKMRDLLSVIEKCRDTV